MKYISAYLIMHTLFEKSNFCPKIQFWPNPNIFTSFSPKIFLTIFLVKSKLSSAKKSKTTTFSQDFHPKQFNNFSREIKVEFLDKNVDFEQCEHRVFIFRPFRIYEGCSALIIRQTFSLVLAMVTQNVFAPFHVIGLLSNFCFWFSDRFFSFDWNCLMACTISHRVKLSLPTNCTILAFVLRANVTYVSSSRLFSYQQKTNKW